MVVAVGGVGIGVTGHFDGALEFLLYVCKFTQTVLRPTGLLTVSGWKIRVFAQHALQECRDW